MINWPQGDSEMCRQIREYPWQTTPLGPIENWPLSLKMVVDLMLASGHAMQLAWGDERVFLYNDAYVPMLSTRHPRALGGTFQEAWPEIWDEIKPLVDKVFVGETVRFEDMPLVMTRHGFSEDTWWNFSYSPIRGESGHVEGLLNVTVEVTAQHLAQQQLRDREERHSFLLKLSDMMRAQPDTASVGRTAMRLVAEKFKVDRAYMARLSRPNRWALIEHECRRSDLFSVEGELDLQRFPSASDHLLNSSLRYPDVANELSLSATDKLSLASMEMGAVMSAVLSRGEEDFIWTITIGMCKPRAWSDAELSLLHDAAERVWAAMGQVRAEEALRTADQHKDRFLAVLAHELRNGLAPLVYNVQIAKLSSIDPGRIKELLARNDHQLQHLVRLVDDLLDVARINTGKIELKLEIVQLRYIVNLAIDANRSEIERKRHRLVVIDEATSGLDIQGDVVRLTQVISNLLSNATKYMDVGGSITVRMSSADNKAVVEVTDTGIGIQSTLLHQVFDMFTQVRDQQAYSAGGLGIGLSLVRQLVRMHGGTVTAASRGTGHGSTFTIYLPVANSSAISLPSRSPPLIAEKKSGEFKVLVVDDKHEVANTLVELLQMRGIDAEAAHTGQEALERAKSRRPNLIFLDLGMPGMDGFEVARRLRELPSEPPMQIIALTGRGRDTDRQQTSAATFDQHLDKPVSEATLQSVLAEAQRLQS